MKKLLILSCLILVGCTNTNSNNTYEKMIQSSVMIMKGDSSAGGSGVILESREDSSAILTNNHICELVTISGYVQDSHGNKHAVLSFIRSKIHDLCLINGPKNLNVHTTIANEAPKLLSRAIVVGHPRLNPTTVTEGYFSDKYTAQINTGVRPCTEDEMKEDTLKCLFNGIMIIKEYEGQLITASVSPGSSGSPVFNSEGEIAGLVFAKSNTTGEGAVVPWEYISIFMSEEAKTLPVEYPTNTKNL